MSNLYDVHQEKQSLEDLMSGTVINLSVKRFGSYRNGNPVLLPEG